MKNNLLKRIVTSIFLITILCVGLFYSDNSWKALIIIFCLLCFYEFYNLINKIYKNIIFKTILFFFIAKATIGTIIKDGSKKTLLSGTNILNFPLIIFVVLEIHSLNKSGLLILFMNGRHTLYFFLHKSSKNGIILTSDLFGM